MSKVVQWHFTAEDLKDLIAGLDMRLAALADARPGFRSPMRARVDSTAERVASLRTQLQAALEQAEAANA
jgi:hypothetical protein